MYITTSFMCLTPRHHVSSHLKNSYVLANAHEQIDLVLDDIMEREVAVH